MQEEEEEEEGTDGERGEGWAREEGETADRSLRGQRREGNGVTQVERRAFYAPFAQHGTYSSHLNLPQFMWYFGITLLLG